MKKITLMCFLLISFIGYSQNEFITTWETTTASESITIPTTGAGYNYTVDWGDATTPTNETGNATHIYTTAGIYTVKIMGTFPRIYFNFTGDKDKIKSIEQWGNNVWTSMASAFYGCTNLINNATDAPDLSSTTDMSQMFDSASSFNADLSSWDVSMITDMAAMFDGATSFNGNISTWNVSNVTTMNRMFNGASSFNRDISTWLVSSVTNMAAMFEGATSFNQDITGWNVSSVTTMSRMFHQASTFNQNIGGWNVGFVTDMSDMFHSATVFNGTLNTWLVSMVTNMNGMFYDASSFNQDISSWDVSSVTDMGDLFDRATLFNQDISGWNVSSVTDMNWMFFQASAFNANISSWNVSNVTTMKYMFDGAASFNQDISGWNVSSVTDMSFMFQNASSFNQNLASWDVSNVINMSNMFFGIALSMPNYDNTLIGWSTLDVGETKIPTGITFDGGNSTYCAGEAARNTLTSTYTWTITDGGRNCAQDKFITTWQTTTASESITIPTTGTGYNYTVDWGDGSPISNGVTGDATHIYATAGIYIVKISGVFPRIFFNFTGDKTKIKSIEQWGNNVWISMAKAFYGCSNLVNNAADAPDLSSVTDMNQMFDSASSFNGDLSTWNVSNVTDMGAMFDGASSFNGNVSSWNVGNVTIMNRMFAGAIAFNQDISSWNVSSVTDMNQMFNNASSFNQNLGSWDISSIVDMSNMFTGIALSTTNYDNTLIGWSTLDTGETKIPTNITFDGGNSIYCTLGEAAWNTLKNTYNWTIIDGGACATLGVNDYLLTNLYKIYPNPAKELLNIDGDLNSVQQVVIYSIIGKQVKTATNNFKSIDVEGLKTGIYFVKVFTNEGSYTIKLIKE